MFNGGQGCEKPFFERAVAALQAPAVALAATPPAFAGLTASADVFDLVSTAACHVRPARTSQAQYVHKTPASCWWTVANAWGTVINAATAGACQKLFPFVQYIWSHESAAGAAALATTMHPRRPLEFSWVGSAASAVADHGSAADSCLPFLQTQRAQQLRTKGGEALGLSWAWDSGFVVAAAPLRAVGWLPEHSDAIGPALGSALKVFFGSILPS